MTTLTRQQSRRVDEICRDDFAMPTIVLMENAARAVADVACEMLGANSGQRIAILCGKGNNGGDGYAAARHLVNRGHAVTIFAVPGESIGDASINRAIAGKMRIPITVVDAAPALKNFDLIIDALLGTGLTSRPREPYVALIEAINGSGAQKILAVDTPSGLDCDTGEPLGACVRATRTITFVTPKTGFANDAAKAYTGPITVGDIGCPREVIDRVLRETG